MASILSIGFISIGIFGLLLGMCFHVYAKKKQSTDWYDTAQQISFRGIAIFVLGIIILIWGGK